uniref:SMB domain-containing protein n=1 Tax=Macrostomum lignano TaxID=282301 RepID=A0A1I8JS88_9PLAT
GVSPVWPSQVTLVVDLNEQLLGRQCRASRPSLERWPRRQLEATGQRRPNSLVSKTMATLATMPPTAPVKRPVVEAVVENLELKRSHLPPAGNQQLRLALACLTSNTKLLGIAELAEAVPEPQNRFPTQRHFGGLPLSFNPVPVHAPGWSGSPIPNHGGAFNQLLEFKPQPGQVGRALQATPPAFHRERRLLVPYLTRPSACWNAATPLRGHRHGRCGWARPPLAPLELADYVGLDTTKFHQWTAASRDFVTPTALCCLPAVLRWPTCGQFECELKLKCWRALSPGLWNFKSKTPDRPLPGSALPPPASSSKQQQYTSRAISRPRARRSASNDCREDCAGGAEANLPASGTASAARPLVGQEGGSGRWPALAAVARRQVVVLHTSGLGRGTATGGRQSDVAISRTAARSHPGNQPGQPDGWSSGAHPPQLREWNSGLLACCEDLGGCVVTFFCGPYQLCCNLSQRMGEGCCTPICLGCAGSSMTLMAYRVKLRARYNIKGSILNDCCATSFCASCVQCQLKRELDYIENNLGLEKKTFYNCKLTTQNLITEGRRTFNVLKLLLSFINFLR